MDWMTQNSLDACGAPRSRMAARWLMGLLLCWGLAAGIAAAQAPIASQADKIAALEKVVAQNAAAAAKAQSAGDNAWMLTSAALVLMMSGPGLALFYGGLVRKKNILGTMMQTFAMMAVITVLWALVTYSLAFGTGNAFIGGLHNFFLRGVGLDPSPAYAATIPLQTYMVYQLMFAIITPALITGAFAERMKFSAMLVFMVLWAIGE
jgi:Amt family ammonium transporter